MRINILPGLVQAALLACLMALLVTPALAREDATDVVAPSLETAESAESADLDVLRADAEADSGLTEDARSRILDLLDKAAEERSGHAAADEAVSELRSRIRSAPDRILELKDLAVRPVPQIDAGAWADLRLDELTAKAREANTALADARDTLAGREEELAVVAGLGSSLSQQIADGTRTLRELERSEDVAPLPTEAPATTAARAAYLAARKARVLVELDKARLTLSNYELLVRLATLERDNAALRVGQLDVQREVLVDAVETRRVAVVRAAREEAEVTQAATGMLPDAVAALAIENARLREELETVTLAGGEAADRMRKAERQASELEADLDSILERVETIGATEAIGRLLRRRLQTLSDVDTDKRQQRARGDEIVRGTDRRIDLGEQRRELSDLNKAVDAVMASIPATARDGFDEAWLRKQTAVLLAAKRDTIDELLTAIGRYLTQLTGYDAAERQLAVTAEAMRAFIRQELLWIRSLPPISPRYLLATPQALAPLVDAVNWRRLLADASASAASNPVNTGLGLLGCLALLGVRPSARRRLMAVGELTSSIRTDAARHTFEALLLTILIAVAWPAILAYLSVLLSVAPEAAIFTRQVALTLLRVAEVVVIFTSVRWVLVAGGLGPRHFRWSQPVREACLRELRWVMPVIIVCAVYVTTAGVDGNLEAREILRRPALIVFSLAILIAIWRFAGRGSTFMTALRAQRPGGVVTRTWLMWFPLLMGVPAANVIASAVGYEYTAGVVMRLMIETAWLVFGIFVLYSVLLRWFTVAERRLRFDRALKQREEARAERERQQRDGAESGAIDMSEVEVPEVDFRALGEQARVTLQAAIGIAIFFSLWAIWSDLLPALTVLQRLDLPFSRSAIVGGVEQQVAVTAGDALISLLVVFGTLFAAKNLPGLLGFTLLRRIVGDAGKQYAIATLCQYALVIGGVVFAFSSVGMEWSKLQWLVAALSVGLGFGLQEIVANFVSGIILLLERPVRVGDVVTVGDATGTVARIQIRATTLIDFDRKELVLPNKELITGRLLNWTLSSNTLRLIVPVGIAYGADVRKARALLLEAAKETEHVLADPAPVIVFNAFGDNALGLELRVYLPTFDYWLVVQTALHDAIYEKFGKAGIGIAFPQRDVHLDFSAPLDIRMQAPVEDGPRWRGRGRRRT